LILVSNKTEFSYGDKLAEKRLFVKILILTALVTTTWLVSLLHLSVAVKPDPKSLTSEVAPPASFFVPKENMGIHQLVLFGNAYQRGLAIGGLTGDLLRQEEDIMATEFFRFFDNPVFRYLFMFATMRWTWGIDKYIDDWAKEETYGVAQFSPTRLNALLDPYTRQLAYHGVHEVGQFFVDIERDDFGCSLIALKSPANGSWILGRNFDFEVGRFFDEEKIMKWEFPDKGNAFLSVIWSGMIGTITGINEKQVYISFNAAGSEDLRRYGTPSTIVVTRALLNANTAEEAVAIIKDATVFIADIYVVADGKTGNLYKIEKTPKRAFVEKIERSTMITNHFTNEHFAKDKTNTWRRENLTSLVREKRGEKLIEEFYQQPTADTEARVLEFLRDKKTLDGKPLHLGNRNAIDALIASHSVIYNEGSGEFFVSSGPGITGPFVGFDLHESFKLRTPIRTRNLARDPELTDNQFYAVKTSLKQIAEAEQLIAGKNCDQAKLRLDDASEVFKDHANYYVALGKYYSCKGDNAKAREQWQIALNKVPAYAKQRQFLKERVF
jgi:hypothetical protein